MWILEICQITKLLKQIRCFLFYFSALNDKYPVNIIKEQPLIVHYKQNVITEKVILYVGPALFYEAIIQS